MKLFKMDKLTYYYRINKERLQHLNGINQDYYMKWFNIMKRPITWEAWAF